MTDLPSFEAIKTVSRRTSLSERTIQRMVDAGSFPKPRRISANRIAWVSSEVSGWISARAEDQVAA